MKRGNATGGGAWPSLWFSVDATVSGLPTHHTNEAVEFEGGEKGQFWARVRQMREQDGGAGRSWFVSHPFALIFSFPDLGSLLASTELGFMLHYFIFRS